MEINKIARKLEDWFRGYYRKQINDKKGEELLSETIYILKKINNNPYDFLNLKVYNCPNCDSRVCLDKDKELEKIGLLENFYCPYCGKKAIEL